MISDETQIGRKWDRASILRALTSAEAQVVASAGTGLLVWAGVISIKVPLYGLHEMALVVKEAVSLVITEITQFIPNIFDGIERNTFSIADAVHIAATAAVIYLGFVFFKRALQALKKINPLHWNLWPRLGLRRKLLLISVLAIGVFVAWQLGAFPQIGSQFLALGRQFVSQLSFQNFSYVSQRLWQAIVSAYENKETVLPVVKCALAAVATYATLEAARVTANFVSPPVRLGYAVYNRAYPWLPKVSLSQRQGDWLHAAASVTSGLVFGFSGLSLPSVPAWAWAALAPGLFLFAKERPNLVSSVSKAGRKLGRYLRAAAEFTLAWPKWVGSLAAGFLVGVAVAGALSASRPLLGFAIMSGSIKAVYTGTAIAALIAAGRGSALLVAHTRQVVSHLTTRARDVGRGVLCLAVKIAKPVLQLGKAVLTPTSRAKTGMGERERIREAMSEHTRDQIAPC